MKLDKTKPYGIVAGHMDAAFEQNGVLFDGAGNSVNPDPVVKDDRTIVTDEVASAQEFLKNILKNGALAKKVIYNEADKNNQQWPNVQKAFETLGLVKTVQNKEDYWRLPEA